MRKRLLKNCRLYVVIDQKTAGKKDLSEIAKKAVTGGADIIQLRFDKQELAAKILNTAAAIKKIAKRNKCLFIVNDRVDIACAIGADGVHLGQLDLPVKEARRLLGKDKIIGISTHSYKQAVDAQKKSVDYISVGPILRTPTKKEYMPVGLSLLKRVSKNIKTPFFAIGGINKHNIDRIIAAGANRIAVVRAVVSAKDAVRATKELKDKII